MSQFPRIKLNLAHQQRFRALTEKEQAVRQFIQNVVRQGEERLAAIAAEGRDLWNEVAKDYSLDLERVQYGPSATFDELIPLSAKLG